MREEREAPSKEAKALSLFLMAYKTESQEYKDKSKRINKLWRLVSRGEYSSKDYLKEVHNVIANYGGYKNIVEKTVQYYIDKTGKWELKGDDKYCRDAQRAADRIMNK